MYRLAFPIFLKLSDPELARKMAWQRSGEFAEFAAKVGKRFEKTKWQIGDDLAKFRKLYGITQSFMKGDWPVFSVSDNREDIIEFMKANKPKWAKELDQEKTKTKKISEAE